MIKHFKIKYPKKEHAGSSSDESEASEKSFEEKRYFKPTTHGHNHDKEKRADEKDAACKYFADKLQILDDEYAVSHVPSSDSKDLTNIAEAAKLRQEKLSVLAKRIDAVCELTTDSNNSPANTAKSSSSGSSKMIAINFNEPMPNESENTGNSPRGALNVKQSSSSSATSQAMEPSRVSQEGVPLNIEHLKSAETSIENLISDVDFTPDNLKKMLGDWLHGSGTISKLRSYFRGLVVTAFHQIPFSPPELQYSGIHESICLLVADFLLQNKMEFSICVFCTEIVSLLGTYTRLKNFASKLINQESVMAIKNPLMETSDVCFILNTFNIHPHGNVGMDILKRYYDDQDGSLLAVMLVVQLVDSWAMRQEFDNNEQAHALSHLSRYKVEFKQIVSKTFSKVQELKMIQNQANRLFKSELIRVRNAEAAKYDKKLQAYRQGQKRLVVILKDFEKNLMAQKESVKSTHTDEEVLLDYANKLTQYFYELKEHMAAVEKKESELIRRENILEGRSSKSTRFNLRTLGPSYKSSQLRYRPNSKSSLIKRARYRRKGGANRQHLLDSNLTKSGLIHDEEASKFSQTDLSLPPDSLSGFRDKSPEITFNEGKDYHPHADCFQLHDENMQLRAVIFEQQKRIDALTKRSQELISAMTMLREKCGMLPMELSINGINNSGDCKQPMFHSIGNHNHSPYDTNRINRRQSDLSNLALFELAINDAKNKCFSLKMEAEMVENNYGSPGGTNPDCQHILETNGNPSFWSPLATPESEMNRVSSCDNKSTPPRENSSLGIENVVLSSDSGSKDSLANFLLLAKNATNSETEMIKNVVSIANAAHNKETFYESDDVLSDF